MDYDDEDDIQLAPELDLSLPPERPYHAPAQTTTTFGERPTSPIQIDEEVVIKNKRKPKVKLIDRLLSDRGLKHLQRDAPRTLKFKGKGHEKQDLMRLLNYYQLWMHDVFPKARFRDCIAMTEKVGHQAQLRVMRKQWIDDSKPKGIEDDIEEVEGLEVLRSLEGGEQQDGGSGTNEDALENGSQEEDLPLFVEDDMSDFDVDEILGRQKANETTTENGGHEKEVAAGEGQSNTRDEFEDEMDAMMDMDDF